MFSKSANVARKWFAMNGRANAEMSERWSRAPSARRASEQKTHEMPPNTETSDVTVLVIQS